jgi:putative glycosyltransferase (TIGR04372 family)
MFARDNQYANTTSSKLDHSSENHRDADIDDYIEAVKFIIEKGGYVVRMGSVVAKEFSYKHPKIIDYAISHRSDFMDIYLPANCYFYLGTSSGGVEIVKVFDRPQAAVNWMPIGSATFGKNEIFIPKKVVYKETGEEVPFDKLMTLLGKLIVRFGDSPDQILEDNHMRLQNNTPEEILELVKEMYARLSGTYIETDAYKEKFEHYHHILSANNHWCSNVYTPIGQDFLLKMKLTEKA